MHENEGRALLFAKNLINLSFWIIFNVLLQPKNQLITALWHDQAILNSSSLTF